jgi:hypothetical protein
VDAIAEAFEDFATVFRIPADLDDSSVNLVLLTAALHLDLTQMRF